MTIDSSSKKFIVSGCSFSAPDGTGREWPQLFMAHLPDYTLINKSVQSRGNGLISRAVIYEVQNQLQNGVLPEDILVAVQWSGWDRHENYVSLPSGKEQELSFERVFDKKTGKYWKRHKVQGFIDDMPDSWEIYNHHYEHKNSKLFYSTFHSDTGKLIESLEHILRTQWFLEKHNIKYFMTTMIKFPDSCDETEHLFQMIDKSKFLPVSGMFEWGKSTGLPLRDDIPINRSVCGHLSLEQNGIFADTVVLPFLINTVTSS